MKNIKLTKQFSFDKKKINGYSNYINVFDVPLILINTYMHIFFFYLNVNSITVLFSIFVYQEFDLNIIFTNTNKIYKNYNINVILI